MRYLNEERFIVHSNTKEAMKNYADNYDRIFRSEPSLSDQDSRRADSCPDGAASAITGADAASSPNAPSDAIEMRFVTITHYCKVCEAMVPDPENHQHHAVICTQPGYNAVVEIPDDDEPCDHCSCAAGASCSTHDE